MSDKTDPVTPEVLDEHGDELIHVPTGQSRLRYIATIALVLFLLVIFVVADLFQSSMTGGGGGTDEVFLTWNDPVSNEAHEVVESEFFQEKRFLSTMMHFRVYWPDSIRFGEPDPKRRSSPEPEEADVASFLVYEAMANDIGVAVSDQEQVEFLRSRFGSDAGIQLSAENAHTTSKEISIDVRRVLRVNKLRELMISTLGIPDPDDVVKAWQEGRPEFKFQSISVNRDNFVATAETEVPDDESLTTWFHARPDFEQRRLYTEERVVPTVAYLPLDGNFDAALLTAAYPALEGVDLDQQAQSYFSQFRMTRFVAPEAEPTEDDATEPQEKPKPFYDFEDVEAQVRAEAPLYAALTAFVTDLQDQAAAGETVDLKAAATALGLTVIDGDPAGLTRAEMNTADTWGSPQIASQLAFGTEGSVLARVTATESGLVMAQVAQKIERAEPAFADIRDDIAAQWSEERAGGLAMESLDYLRQTLATKPDDVDAADWAPEISWDVLRAAANEATYSVYDRPWLERSALPEGKTFQTASPTDVHLMLTPAAYEMEAGTVGAAAKSNDGKSAFLVRFDSQRAKDVSEIDANTVLNMRRTAAQEQQRDFGAKVFLGDGAWLTERASLRFPKNEKREAEKAEKTEKTEKTAG